MSEIHRKAMVARELQANAAFLEICEEIKADAGKVFFNPASTLDQLAVAHGRIRSIETFAEAVKSRLDAQSVADKKDQHRARHD